jgi:hypothetical protein
MGAVGFLHRFGSSLNPHFHYHLCVVDGLFEKVEGDTVQDQTAPSARLRFHEAVALSHEPLERLQNTIGNRSDQILYVLPGPDPAGRTALRLSALEFLDRLAKILPPPRIHRHRYHGVFAPNAPLRPLVTARAQEGNALAPRLPDPDVLLPAAPTLSLPTSEAPSPRPSDPDPAPPSRWASLLARIYEAFPLISPACQTPLTFIAFLTDPEPITQILAHIGEPTSPPLLHPARGPPQTELAMGPGGGEAIEVAQGCFPDDLDQSPEFDPTEPEPIPEDHFDQSRGA